MLDLAGDERRATVLEMFVGIDLDCLQLVSWFFTARYCTLRLTRLNVLID